jgi:hypothetical protein
MIGPMTEAAESRLLRNARSPEDAAFVARFDQLVALPLVLAALLPIFLLAGESTSALVVAVVVASWLVFLADLVVHERRIVHYLSTWWGRFDLTVVILTAPWFLLVDPSHTKFVMLARLDRSQAIAAPPGGSEGDPPEGGDAVGGELVALRAQFARLADEVAALRHARPPGDTTG